MPLFTNFSGAVICQSLVKDSSSAYKLSPHGYWVSSKPVDYQKATHAGTVASVANVTNSKSPQSPN